MSHDKALYKSTFTLLLLYKFTDDDHGDDTAHRIGIQQVKYVSILKDLAKLAETSAKKASCT